MKPLQANTKDIAEFFRLGLQGGLVPLGDAIRWADDLIASSWEPEEAVLDLSLSEAPGRLAALSALSAFRGSINPVWAERLLLAWCHRLVMKGMRDEFAVLSALRGLPLAQDLWNRVNALDDAKYLAEDGQYGTTDEVRTDVRVFLAEFDKYGFLLPKQAV